MKNNILKENFHFFQYRSLSFVMVTSGLAFFLIGLVYLMVDVKQWWFGEPFLAAGELLVETNI